jgi:hypothetical protein
MTIIARLFQMPRSKIMKSTREMWSEVAMAHAIAEYNSGRMKLAPAAKKLLPHVILYAEKRQNTVVMTA